MRTIHNSMSRFVLMMRLVKTKLLQPCKDVLMTSDCGWLLINFFLMMIRLSLLWWAPNNISSKFNISIGQCEITPTSSVRNLGMWFDSTLSMNSHINKTCSLAFYYLYNIRKIRKYLSRETSEKLIHAFVRSHIDYCNRPLFSLTAYQIH